MRYRIPFATCLMLAVVCAGALPALAYEDDDDDEPRVGISEGEFLFHIGVFEPRGSSDLWKDNERLLTQDVSDFDEAIGGIAFATRLNPFLDIVFGGEYYDAKADVRYRDFTTASGGPVQQRHRLRQLPFEVSLKVYIVPRETRNRRGRRELRPVVPYVGGGGGALLWHYREKGLFVDDPDDPVSTASFDKRNARGVAGSYHAFAGIEIQFSREVAVSLEGRYRWAKDRLGSQFDPDLDRFDLSGGSLSAGMGFRF